MLIRKDQRKDAWLTVGTVTGGGALEPKSFARQAGEARPRKFDECRKAH
jgi:hypothetical protein